HRPPHPTWRTEMKRAVSQTRRPASLVLRLVPALGLLLATAAPAIGQDRGNPEGEWRYQSADPGGTRYPPLNQINAQDVEDLTVAWEWRGDNFGDHIDPVMRSTPSYIDGGLYTVAGYRRAVISIDPATGENLWMYREPHTERHQRSMRSNYGKGVGHAFI